MHPLMARVLELRQLNSAGQLFALSDYDVITDLSTAFQRVKEIFNNSDYTLNRVDQSVIEIVIARITAAIRETSSIETYCAELVDVLDSCLKHNMLAIDDKGNYGDSPHCKIANDLLSCLFLNYNKRSVMTLALPVAIKALGCGNQDLVKNVSNYISLASIHNGKALAHYAIQIISHSLFSHIHSGNLSLLRVLPQIYNENREPFHAHLSPLLDILENKEADCSDKLSLLQLTSMIANNKPDLLAPYLSKFDSFLRSPSTCAAVLNIYMSMISQSKAHHLAPYLESLKEISSKPAFASNRVTVSKIIGNIGRVSPQIASNAMEELMRSAKHADSQLQPSILNEIEGIAAAYPQCIRPYVESLRQLSTSSNSRIIDRIITSAGVSSRASHSGSHVIPAEPTTTIYVPGPNSNDSLTRTYQQRINGYNSNILTSEHKTVFSVDPVDTSTRELDINTQCLAMKYQNTSSGSLSRMNSKSGASMNGPRSISENVSVSREWSQSSIPTSLAGSGRVPSDYTSRPPPQYQPPKSSTLSVGFDASHIQMGRDGRVRPMGGGARRLDKTKWPAGSYETTFPANSDPVTTTKMHPLTEEDENQWNGAIDRSDVVLQFVDHRRNKIRKYVSEVSARFPIPLQCTVEGSKSSKHRMLVHFGCQSHVSNYCVFNDECLFAFKTKQAASWLHLMFLQMQCSALENGGSPVAQSSNSYQTLAKCWQCLPQSIHKHKPFVTLVTSAFPSVKDQEKLLKELENVNFFDCFNLDSITNRWNCFSCSYPDKVRCFVEEGEVHKMLEGHLKEKKGRWRFLRRWHTKYFTLSSAALTCSKQQVSSHSVTNLPTIDLKSIRSVRSLGRGKKNRKSLRRAFEIFTSDNSSVVLKATDEKQAEEWLHCIQIAVAAQRSSSVKRDV